MNKSGAPRLTFELSAAICTAFAGAISLLAAAGWLFNQPLLASFNSKYIPMAPATAIIFLGLCATWLILRVFPHRRWVRRLELAALVGIFIIVFILALRYFTGLGPDLEKILYPAPPLFGRFSSARMSPMSALGFFLAILAFLLLTAGAPGTRTHRLSAVPAVALFIFSSLVILGYLYGAPPFYGGTLTPMAVTSALAFWFLSLALLMTVGPTGFPVRVFLGASLKARLLRTFIPASLLIVLLQGLLSTAADPWVINPAIKVAVAALLALLVVLLIVSMIANSLSAEIERSERARLQAENTLKLNEARFRTLAETANDAIINIDRNGRIVFWNRAAETIFGYSAAEVNGKALDMVMPEKFAADHQQGFKRVVLTGESHLIGTTVEVTGLRKDGREFPMTLSLATWQVAGEVFFTGIAHDISARRHAELLQNAIYRIAQATITSEGIEALYRSIHSILGELIPVENFFIALYDPVAASISFPYFVDQHDSQPAAPTKLQGPTGYIIRTGHSLLANRAIFDRLVLQGEFQPVGTEGVDWMGAPLKLEGGVIGVMAVKSYRPEIRFNQQDLNLLEFVSTQVAQAIERKRMEEQIRTLSLNDELTGLYNRRGFTLLAEQVVSQADREKRSMLLYFGDVDDLKMINDTFGHAQGDLALQDVAAILKSSFREGDILARFGGDEFVVLAVKASRESADFLTKRIRDALEAHNQTPGRSYRLSLSSGIVRYDPEVPCTMNELIAKADARMYAMKQARKGKTGSPA
jgi:diguanylate cyclase (GGDEF)-like protein/PAS domain S-box-containing protein